MSELTKVFLSGCIISKGSFFGCMEIAKMGTNAVYLYLRNVLLFVFAPKDAFIPTGVISLLATIHCVFGIGADPKVCAAIVKAVAVDVVNVHSPWRAGDCSMHENSFSSKDSSCASRGIPFIHHFLSTPFPLIEMFKIFIVNQRNLAPSKWNGFRHLSPTKPIEKLFAAITKQKHFEGNKKNNKLPVRKVTQFFGGHGGLLVRIIRRGLVKLFQPVAVATSRRWVRAGRVLAHSVSPILLLGGMLLRHLPILQIKLNRCKDFTIERATIAFGTLFECLVKLTIDEAKDKFLHDFQIVSWQYNPVKG